jgi:hypothetical protein
MNREDSYVSSFTAEPELGKSRLHGRDHAPYSFDYTGVPVEVVEALDGGLFCLFLYDFDARQIDWSV